MPDEPQTVLVVDDEPSLLRMMQLYLARLGCSVVCCGSTDQAWETVQAAPGRFAIAVLDMTMPGLSALELGARLLSLAPEIRVVVASGYPVDLAGLEDSAPGRVSFLHKPFTPEMLAAMVGRPR